MAVGLHCFDRYCRIRSLRHPEIDAFLDDLWEFPLIDHERWDDWEVGHPGLVRAGLGDSWPPGFEETLSARSIDPGEFRCLVAGVVEIVFSSFYGAADDHFSMKCLRDVLGIAAHAGVEPPSLRYFAGSRFVDCHGWGARLSPRERDIWRGLEPPVGPVL